eukprot:UN05920
MKYNNNIFLKQVLGNNNNSNNTNNNTNTNTNPSNDITTTTPSLPGTNIPFSINKSQVKPIEYNPAFCWNIHLANILFIIFQQL